MVRKLRARAASQSDSQLAAAIKDSAQQIWLAGVGAFAKAQQEGNKVFETLAREGNSIQKRTMRVTEDKVNEVTNRIGRFAGRFQHQANDTWDRLEGVFEERVERALKRLGVPTNKEITELSHRVEKLTASVNKLSGGPAKAAKKKAAPRKRAVRKAAAAA
jgi:poly(hydroxyalkanoate) granule-associated protein